MFWTPQVDDSAPADFDEVMADLRVEADMESRVEDARVDPGQCEHCLWDYQDCRCYDGDSGSDEGDGYAAGGWDMGEQWE